MQNADNRAGRRAKTSKRKRFAWSDPKGPAYIDLFCGIGGFHRAFDVVGGRCVLASDIDPAARKTYAHNFKDKTPELFENGQALFPPDVFRILRESHDEAPPFDVICAGFPCQPFSAAGRGLGFADPRRGNLFYALARLLHHRRPIAFLFENVRNIESHDGGRTWKIIEEIIDGLGYRMEHAVTRAVDYGLPQNRPRMYMVGFRKDAFAVDSEGRPLEPFAFPHADPTKKNEVAALRITLDEVLGGTCAKKTAYTLRCGGRNSGIDDRHNWDGYRVQINGETRLVRLTPEMGRALMGFPDDFSFPDDVTEPQRMRQLGNSVAVAAVEAILRAIVEHVDANALDGAKPNEHIPLEDEGHLRIISDVLAKNGIAVRTGDGHEEVEVVRHRPQDLARASVILGIVAEGKLPIGTADGKQCSKAVTAILAGSSTIKIEKDEEGRARAVIVAGKRREINPDALRSAAADLAKAAGNAAAIAPERLAETIATLENELGVSPRGRGSILPGTRKNVGDEGAILEKRSTMTHAGDIAVLLDGDEEPTPFAVLAARIEDRREELLKPAGATAIRRKENGNVEFVNPTFLANLRRIDPKLPDVLAKTLSEREIDDKDQKVVAKLLAACARGLRPAMRWEEDAEEIILLRSDGSILALRTAQVEAFLAALAKDAAVSEKLNRRSGLAEVKLSLPIEKFAEIIDDRRPAS
jgi:site-specific DNA-cytosine methylase